MIEYNWVITKMDKYIKETNLFKKFLIESEKSQLTIESYLMDIKLFLEYIYEKNLNLYHLTNEDLKTYKSKLHDGYAITTINRKLVSINKFLKFLDIDIYVKQEKTQLQTFLDHVFTTEEINKIIEQCELHKDYRAKALISTAMLTGMRVSEILQLNVDDVNKNNVTIKGKGNKYRKVFISKKLQIVLKEYLDNRKTTYKTKKLFVGQRGAINRCTVYSTVRKYAEKAGVDWRKGHPHNLRHYTAKELLNVHNIDIGTVADILGHENIQTTRIYTRKTSDEILDVMDKLGD